jgi:hypothetical protein
MFATSIRRSAAYRATTLVEVAYSLSAAVEEGRNLMAESSGRHQGRFAAREWELTRWFNRVASFLDGLSHVLGAMQARSPQGGHTLALADETLALATAVVDDEQQTLARWGLRQWRQGEWEVDNLELDYQLRSRPEELLAALEAFSSGHMAPLLVRWRNRLGHDAAAQPWAIAG